MDFAAAPPSRRRSDRAARIILGSYRVAGALVVLVMIAYVCADLFLLSTAKPRIHEQVKAK